MRMNQNSAASTPTPNDARRWPQVLARYRQPSNGRGLVEVAITVVPLAALWLLAWLTLDVGYWLTLPLALASGAFLLRLFMIQHDCSHGSFFRYRLANDWIGRLAGIVTMTPYDVWRRTHATHHASSGNLDRRGMGDVDTLTVEEYRARSMWGRLRYRLYRHPLVMFGLGPAYLFLLQHRLPIGLMRGNGWRPWISTMANNLTIALVAGGLIWLIGIKAFLLVHLPALLVAASIGVWLFYVQHQFEDTVWRATENGMPRTLPCTAARITICRPSCAGSRPTSACTTCITCRSEEHTSELQSHHDLVCRLLLEKKKEKQYIKIPIQHKKPQTQ